MMEGHKSGFVSIVGRPNVGKSTLMNKVVGERLSAITPKAQTTRHRIIGIYNDEKHQIVFSDTPGIIDPAYKLHEGMMGAVSGALTDADAVLYVVELGEQVNESIQQKLSSLKCPLFVLINKIDLSNADRISEETRKYHEAFPVAYVLPISALNGLGTEDLLDQLKALMPEHPPYFDKDEITDRPVRFFVTEIIRENMLLLYKKEVPYSVEVVVEEYKESERIDRIRAIIFCERDTQRQIIIGKGGDAIKRLGIEARKQIETFVGRQVHLDLHVKVRKDWRNNPLDLKRFGYTTEQ